jgi:hypothetical protein
MSRRLPNGTKSQLTDGQRHQAVGAVKAMLFVDASRDEILDYLTEKFEMNYAEYLVKTMIDDYMEAN